MDSGNNSVPLATVTRGGIVESLHRGYVAVVDAAGRVLWGAGDPCHVTYYRSSAKLIQALPIVASGAVDRFGITQLELAVICASHRGQDCHVEAVRSILAKIGLDESYLLCGVHRPVDGKQTRRLIREGREPTPIYNNCSGKHAGMLAYALHVGYPLDNYVDAQHPVQVDMHAAVAEVCGLASEQVIIGVDGCGVAVFGMPVANMAYAYARLAEPDAMPRHFHEAAVRVRSAMMENPVMVGGDGDLGTRLMQAYPGRLLAKGGAEGLFCVAALKFGVGICIKVEDGSPRALPVIVAEVLRQLGMVEEGEPHPEALSAMAPVINHRKEIVGHYQPCFRLQPGHGQLVPPGAAADS